MSCTYSVSLSLLTLKRTLMSSWNRNIYKANAYVRSDESDLLHQSNKFLIRKWTKIRDFPEEERLDKRLFIYPLEVLYVETFNLQKLIYKVKAKIYARNDVFITEMEQIAFGIILLGWGLLGDFLFNFPLTSNWIKNIAVSKVKAEIIYMFLQPLVIINCICILSTDHFSQIIHSVSVQQSISVIFSMKNTLHWIKKWWLSIKISHGI